MNLFIYNEDIVQQYPDVCGGMLYVQGIQNGPSPDELISLYVAEQQKVQPTLPKSLADLPSVSAWRGAFRRFGANPTKNRSAVEALLRRLQKKGDIPSINTLVDIGNLVSIRYALPVAFLDLRDVKGTITVQLADGDERFTELGSQEVVHPEPGEVIFADETDMVVARRWCWRQSLESASRADTTDILVTVESQHEGCEADVRAALDDLEALIDQFAGGKMQHGIVSAESPDFSID